MLRSRFLSLLLVLLPLGCKQREENERARQLVWGRDVPPTELEKRAKEPIDAKNLDQDDATLRRVLEMSFEEVVARMGFVEYRGTAELDIGTEPRKLSFHENSLIEHGLHGSMHVLQLDRAKKPLREMYYDGGVIFVSNGGGKLRAQGIAAIEKQHIAFREEAFEPLRTFTGFYGKRLAVARDGEVSSNGRTGIKYSFALRKGDELVKYGKDTPKLPKKVVGSLVVDEETGVPLEVKLNGEFDVPNPEKPDVEPGHLQLALSFVLKSIEGKELKPTDFIPAIERHPTDLDPLAFLEGRVRTSTVIGGKRPAPPPEEEEAEEPTPAPVDSVDAGTAPEEATPPPAPPPAKAEKKLKDKASPKKDKPKRDR